MPWPSRVGLSGPFGRAGAGLPSGSVSAQRILITGGCGFLGRRLAAELLVDADHGRGAEVDEIVLVDQVALEAFDPRVRTLVADIRSAELAAELASGPDVVVHLASVVSAGAEADWTTAVDVNIRGLLDVLEACRRASRPPRFLLTSSVAVFGGAGASHVVGDGTRQTPLSTYGMTKSVGELLVDDATRKGFIDGRTARLPTVIVRPGRPNAAASSFCSGVFREPLAGLDMVVPVGVDTPVVVIGADTAVAGLAALTRIDGADLGPVRSVNLPGLEVTVTDMLAALDRAGRGRKLGLVEVQPDPAVEAVVASWPARWDDTRARGLGLPADESLDAIVDGYLRSLAGTGPGAA